MRTRFQGRTAAVHAVLLNVDLLAIMLALVPGDARARRTARDAVSRVCSTWAEAWVHVARSITPCPTYTHSAYLSIADREVRVRELASLETTFHNATRHLRARYIDALGCRRVPSLHVVLYVALSIETPYCRPRPLPAHLWEYVVRLRDLVARSIVRSRTSYPSLPGWYEIAPDDPLHAALL